MGLFGDLSELEKDVYGDIENDPELEAELLALQQDDEPQNRSPNKQSPMKPSTGAKPKCQYIYIYRYNIFQSGQSVRSCWFC